MTLLAVFVATFAGGVARGHHSYAEYDRSKVVALEGTISKIMWVNPHVLLTIDTSSGAYLVEWWSLTQFGRAAITADTLKVGDHVVVRGSVNRNPEKKIITLLKEVRRPADGWVWADTRAVATR
jgi:hypothetical protein